MASQDPRCEICLSQRGLVDVIVVVAVIGVINSPGGREMLLNVLQRFTPGDRVRRAVFTGSRTLETTGQTTCTEPVGEAPTRSNE